MRMVYVTEEYYQSEYLCGRDSALEESFLYYAAKASQKIDQYTYGRLKSGWDVTDDVKICCCELAEYLYSCDDKEKQTAGLKSYSNDGDSGTFDTESFSREEKEKKIRSIIRAYLSDSGILYQGRYKEER